MKKLLYLVLFLAGCSGQVHIENDIGAFLNHNDDKNFTHGTKFSYFDDSENKRETYSLGQNIYTPGYKKSTATKEQLNSSRPYTGWLYGEYRNATIKDSVKTIYGIQAGCSGRCSFAKETQQGIHKLLDQNAPTWNRDYSLKSEPGIILEGEKYYGMVDSDYFTANLLSRLRLGNIIDSVSGGSSFTYGVGAERFAPEPIIFKTPKERGMGENTKESEEWSYYIFGDSEIRAIPYNHFLDGSLFQNERHTVNSNFFVGEANLGFRVGYKHWKFSYNYTVITDEWDGQYGPFFFGGIDLAW